MATSKEIRLTAAVGALSIVVATVASHFLTGGRRRKTRDGYVLCPSDVGKTPAPTASLRAGDFVVVQLASGDRSFTESTWAQVQSVDASSFVARLTGELGEFGVKPLSTSKHGYRLGREIVLDRGCVWDVFRPSTFSGQVLCGSALSVLDPYETPPLRPLGKGLVLEVGDRVLLVVASNEAEGTAWWETLPVRIVSMSASGQVLTGIVDAVPETSEHGLSQGSFLQFNRDCVVKVF